MPYGDPGEVHGWKNAFDAGEWGLGRMTQPLTLGCDCLGEIHYFDATIANEQGKPWVISNAICMHEEDYGILWKHVDLMGGRSRGAAQPAPRRELHRDGRQLRVRLLLVLLSRRQHPARGEADRHRVADGDRAGHAARVRERDRGRRRRAAPSAPVQRPPRLRRRRLRERGVRGRRRAHAGRSRQPVAERVPRSKATRFETETDAQRETDAAHVAHVAHRQPERAQRARPADVVQARADDEHADAAGASRLADRPARRLRAAQPLGHAVRARRAARRGRVPEPAPGRRRPPALDRAGPRRSRAPTSSSGTRSASRTSCGPRTGRSCRSSTPASR